MKTTSLRNTLAALFIAAFALPAQAQTKEAYVQKSADGTSITFYYDTQLNIAKFTSDYISANCDNEKEKLVTIRKPAMFYILPYFAFSKNRF